MGNAGAANLGVGKDLDIQVQLGSKTRGRTRRSGPGARVEKSTAMAAHVGVAAPCCWLVELEVALFKSPCYLGEH